MTAHSLIRRCISLLLLLAILLGYLPAGMLNAQAQENTSALSEEKTNLRNGTGEDILVPTYPDIADHHLVSNNPYPQDTPQMGGFAYLGVHAYFVRTAEDGKTAAVYRTHLKNQSTGSVTFADAARLGEGKSMTAAGVNGGAYLFVSTGKTGTDAILLIQDVGGGTVNLKGGYTLQTIDGTPLQADSLAVLSVSGKNATLLIRSSYSFYTATMDATVTGDGTLTADFAFGMEEAATETMAKTLVSSPNALDVQLTGMDYEKEQDRLYLGVAVDCSTGILVYSNLSALIDSHTTAAEAALDQSIVVAGSGYEFFHVKDISVVQGVIYFSSMQRWITSNSLRGDICQLLDTSVPSQHRMQGFRESGTYLIGGTDDPSLVFKNIPDGNGYKIRIESLTGTPADAHLFGFESDAQGYWYIRSGIYIQGKAQAADLYLTAEADGTVSLKPKSAGDPNQLWYLQSKGLHKDNNGKENKIMAIYSKASGLYLGNGSSGDAIFDVCVREEGKTFVLQLVNDTAKLESYLFDYEFYKLAYPKEVGNLSKDDASAHFENTGKALGYLPSPYFDAKYYLAHNKDVRDAYGETNYERAYYHFINYGYWEGRQGSLYFSAKEYISRDKTQNAYKLYFPEKEKILYHFINYGSPDAATADHWSGSNSFSVKEYAEEYNLTVSEKQMVNDNEKTVTLGDVLLREYVASLIRLQDCATIEEFYDLIFDVEVYKYMNRTDLTADKVSTITTAQATYNDKLTLHWEKYGRTEGRTASFIFNPSYYTSRYPDKVVSLSNAYEHYFNTGRKEGLVGSPYIAMSTEADITCKHPLTSTARFTACDETGGLVTFCAKCHAVVNRIDAPAIAHTDSDGNHVCDLCKGTINEPLLTQNTILGLDLPGKDNALFADLSGFKHGSTNKPYGTYYLVHKGADGVHRVFDPMSQTLAGTIAATQVKVVDGRIIGADPGMAVQIHQKNADNTEDTNHYSIEMEGGYYLYIGSEPIRIIRSNDTAKRNITVEVGNGNTTISLVRNLNISNPEYNNSSVKITLTNYLAFEQLDGNNYFEWSPMKGSKDVDNFFYLYRLAEDQLHTEGLYDVLQRAVSFIPTNSLYDITAHKNLLQMVHDAVELYKQYNGIPLTGEELANKDELQKSLDLLERKIIDVLGILEINLRNSTVKYFSANMYNWDEDAMNALVATLPDADTKGFFFENAENTIGNAPYSFYDKTNSETVDGLTTYAQMYSIYSGIAAKDLSDSINPPFSNSVVAADYWSEATIDSVKDVYTNVNVPFVYKDGYYTLDSDQNGVFFEEEPASNATLAILEKPLTYYWSSGTTYGVGVPGHQAETLYSYRPSNNYVTGFQPFAQVTEFSAKSYKTDAYTAKLSTPVDSYMIDGIGWNSGATPTITGSGRGTPEWGFGMKLDVNFLMTEDGCLEGDETKPITFSFSGDDDVWIFIDGKLVMDIGGSHDAIQGEINFATGEVILRSDKFGRIRDKNEAGYGRSGDSNPLNASNEIGSILTNKMYQSVNFYSEIFDESITEFAASGEHTLTVYYMDRGKGRTNCAIKFNLPQADTLVVEKEIPGFYVQEDGTLTNEDISEDTMNHLGTLDFGFTLTKNGNAVGLQPYNLFNENGIGVGTKVTDRLGHFTLKAGWRAEFRNLQFNGQTYQVAEDALNGRWGTAQWSGAAANTVLSPTTGAASPEATVIGGQYESEVITFHCTNTYTYNPELIPEEQVVVMDYGKPIDIAVIDNAVFDGISDLVAREGILKAVDLKDPADANYVTVQKNTSTNRDVRVSLKKMLDKAISLNCTVKVTLDDGAVHDNLVIPVTILPATIMYYETDFLTDPNSVIFSTEAKPLTEEDKYQWSYKESGGKDTLQDSGEVGDIVYKPAIDKESIPSNAFFVDFDGEGYRDRYSTDPLYGGYDFDSEETWLTASGGISGKEVNTTTGTMTLTFDSSKASNYRYMQTVIPGNTQFTQQPPLSLLPGEKHYVEARFKIENCEIGTEVSYSTFALYFSNSQDNNVKEDGRNTGYAYCELNTEDILSEKYITVKLPLDSCIYYNDAKLIDALRFQIFNVTGRSGGVGKIILDYLYVGPEMGWAESVNSNYLYFGFGNTDADRLRYSTAAYGRNFDQPTDAYWATANTTGGSTTDFTISSTEGTVTIPVSENPDATNSNYGPSIMTTAVPGSYPVKSDKPVEGLAPLRFDTRNADYIQIRFKTENCEWSTDGTHKLIFLYSYMEDGVEKFDSADIRIDFSILNGEYQTLRVPVPVGKKLKNGDTLTAFGLRFRGIKSIAGQNGTVTIDELFIGSYEALTRLDEGEDFLFFDFTDTDADKVRYSGSTYGGINFGSKNWVGTYSWDNESHDPATIENGILSIPRSQAYDYTYAQSGGSESSRCFRYNPKKAEIFAVRFKMDNTLSVTSKSRIRLDYLTESANGNYVKAAEAYLNTETGAYDNYKTVIIDITNEVFLAANLIRSIRVDFWYLEGVGSIHIDSIYVGPKAVSNPAADSLFIGFDNLQADRDRYDSDTYGYLNPDEEAPLRWWDNSDKVDSVSIDNQNGVAEIIAVKEIPEKDSEGNFLWPDIYLESSASDVYLDEYLDYKPQNAEIFQIRFKMENFVRGQNQTGTNITPYVKLQWRIGGETENKTYDASETIYLNTSVLTSGDWITVTARIPAENRHYPCITGIRPYFGGIISESQENQGKLTIDYIYIGPDDRPDQVYGYDSHYNNDTALSDGHSLFVEGSGVKLNESVAAYTEASFTFKGTGFDLISRTGPQQATIRVEVRKEGAENAEKALTVNNKGELELYQIPIVSVQGLAYGTYTVRVWVNKAITNSAYDFLNRGGEFYFDAVRIYDPMGNDTEVPYRSDREAYNYIKEIRNILLSKEKFEAISGVTEGAVFVDVNSTSVDPETGTVIDPETGEPIPGSTEYYTADVQTYNKTGPKNEVYLAPGQAVAFNLQVGTNQPIASLDIGAKTIVGCTANLEIGILTMDDLNDFSIATRSAYTVRSATAQYQEVDVTGVQVKVDNKYQPMYVVIYNTSPANSSTDLDTVAKNVISLTDLKVAYKGNPGGEIPGDSLGDPEISKRSTSAEEIPVQLLVDGNTMPATRHFVAAVNETPILDEDAKIGHSLNLASDIAINYILRKTDLEDYDTFVLECRIPEYEGNTYIGDRLVTLSPVDKGEYWYFTLNGLTAVHMMDEVSAKLVMTAGARTYYSETDTYSIAQYAMTQLQKDKSSATLKALCANLLRYGAKAQAYKGYRTNALADRDLSQEQKAHLTDLSTVAFGNHNSVLKQLEQPWVLWKGKALLLDSKVTLRYAVSIASYDVPIEELSVRVSYTDYQGKEKTALLTHGQVYGTATGYYTFDFDGLLAAELRTPVYATVYHGDTPVSDTLCYSVDSYGKNKPDPLNALCRSLLAYSDCAKAYFGSK